jgi:hypothetical protein
MTQSLREALSSALAHAGHGHTDPSSILHMLTEPVHAALLAAPAALGVALLWARRGRRSRTERRSSSADQPSIR